LAAEIGVYSNLSLLLSSGNKYPSANLMRDYSFSALKGKGTQRLVESGDSSPRYPGELTVTFI
jgi:hypothetical protein